MTRFLRTPDPAPGLSSQVASADASCTITETHPTNKSISSSSVLSVASPIIRLGRGNAGTRLLHKLTARVLFWDAKLSKFFLTEP